MVGVEASTKPVVIVTADSHVGPPLDLLRPYCEQRYLEEFDAAAALPAANSMAHRRARVESLFAGDEEGLADYLHGWILRNAESTGIYDMDVRLADLDHDGVSGEVIFHGTPNAQGDFIPVPFHAGYIDTAIGKGWTAQDRDMAAVGRRIYNRWLADFCSVAPERHVGLCQIPVWDLDASVKEVRWAAAHGLRGVNFPHPQWQLPPYEDTSWDLLFAACADLGMPLTTHIGGGNVGPTYTGLGAMGISLMEFPAVSGRNLWHLIFAGVFDRHPGLTLVITEVPGTWFTTAVRDMESVYSDPYRAGPQLRGHLAKRPRDYVAEHVYFGTSFMSRAEAVAAVEFDLADRIMWGSDYPHPEGTWAYYPHTDDKRPSVTRLSLANTFAGLDEAQVRSMAGTNAIKCYGLDATALAAVAERIGPSLEELTTPPDLSQVPADYVGCGFRTSNGSPWT
jgi:predicted TIM-barrel fold metal-dependent hydrolase